MDASPPSSCSLSPNNTCVKKEAPEEIKEFAETAMNELLGWYGYERLELRKWAAAARQTRPAPSADQHNDNDECSWCKNAITTDSALHQSGAKFCSELCFSQSRRANFKRAKTCDWCRHVRHTVAYVDFQDGATQLQFCSDKCLNQYKMHIFCRETQAHLDLNPHLADSASTSNLITPELWLKNCRSRSTSPNSDKSNSPAAENLTQQSKPEQKSEKRSPLPLIKVAPTSKLMKSKASEERVVLQTPENKREQRNSKANLRKRRASRSSTATSQNSSRQNSTVTAKTREICSPPSTMDESSPTPSTMGNGIINSPPQPHNINHNLHPHSFPMPMFGSLPPPGSMYEGIPPGHINDPRFPRVVLQQPNFLPRPGMLFNERARLPPPPLPYMPMGLGQPPPVTILVPYPIAIPLPIPIPIPLPAMMQAFNLRTPARAGEDDATEGPLDFTMNSDKGRECSDANPEMKESAIDTIKDKDSQNKTETDEKNLEQSLPRFKITRMGNKMAKIVRRAREPPESSRPLRKRRRLVEVNSDDDCTPLMHKSRKTVEV